MLQKTHLVSFSFSSLYHESVITVDRRERSNVIDAKNTCQQTQQTWVLVNGDRMLRIMPCMYVAPLPSAMHVSVTTLVLDVDAHLVHHHSCLRAITLQQDACYAQTKQPRSPKDPPGIMQQCRSPKFPCPTLLMPSQHAMPQAAKPSQGFSYARKHLLCASTQPIRIYLFPH